VHVPVQVPYGRRLVIVGTGYRAAVAYECFSRDSPYEVAAFSVEAAYSGDATYCGLPLVPLEEVKRTYPPPEYLAFVAVSPSDLNRDRRRVYDAVRSIGYSCISYISSQAFVAQNAEIGANTFVQEFVAVQYRVRIGDNVVIESGTCVGHSTVIEDDCFIGQHVAISGFCRIGRGSFIGDNSCMSDNIRIAEECEANAGAVILKNTISNHVYIGNPARPVRRSN
jgi:sugar O-acyltransferase (sialic acid O-acetyltransferase NeuD family)